MILPFIHNFCPSTSKYQSCYYFYNGILLCSPACTGTRDLPASAAWILPFKACTTPCLFFVMCLKFFHEFLTYHRCVVRSLPSQGLWQQISSFLSPDKVIKILLQTLNYKQLQCWPDQATPSLMSSLSHPPHRHTVLGLAVFLPGLPDPKCKITKEKANERRFH